MITNTRYALDCHGGGSALGAPSLAIATIDRKQARFIIKMADLVVKHGLHKVEQFNNDVWWFDDHPLDGDDDESPPEAADIDPMSIPLENGDDNLLRTECDSLVVTDDSFFFSCYRKHDDYKIETESVPIHQLAADFSMRWQHPHQAAFLTDATQPAA